MPLLEPSLGTVLRQAREVRGQSAAEAALSAGISATYLGRLESDAGKRPSPHVLHRLGAGAGGAAGEEGGREGEEGPGGERAKGPRGGRGGGADRALVEADLLED